MGVSHYWPTPIQTHLADFTHAEQAKHWTLAASIAPSFNAKSTDSSLLQDALHVLHKATFGFMLFLHDGKYPIAVNTIKQVQAGHVRPILEMPEYVLEEGYKLADPHPHYQYNSASTAFYGWS